MRKKIENFLASPYLTVALLFYCVLLIFIATWAQLEIGVENSASLYFESFFAVGEIKGVSFPIIGGATIGVLATINIFFSLFKYLSFGLSGVGSSIVHCSLVLLILSGALQYSMRESGRVSIREGEASDTLFVKKNGAPVVEKLPFSIKLLDFSKEYWNGSDIPKSFSSSVVFTRGKTSVKVLIKMNSPASFSGWTFYQTSYSENGAVSELTAVKNPARMLPWLAVMAAFVGMLMSIFARVLGVRK